MCRLVRCFAILAVFCSPAYSAPLVVVPGDYYPVLSHDDAVEIAGGRVDKMNIFGTPVAITAGSVGDRGATVADIYTGSLSISGGTVAGFAKSHGTRVSVHVDARYLRVSDRGREEGNSWKIQGFLTDGSFVDLILTHDLATSRASVTFEVSGAEPPAGDTDSDWDVDLHDLNAVRNGFGTLYGMEDLNAARNDFGFGSGFTLDPEFGLIANPVPEPNAAGLVIVFVSLAGFAYLIATAQE